ncbi:MAG: RHS repeat domain-containing protein, partial [Dermatophilaceae bacterium]
MSARVFASGGVESVGGRCRRWVAVVLTVVLAAVVGAAQVAEAAPVSVGAQAPVAAGVQGAAAAGSVTSVVPSTVTSVPSSGVRAAPSLDVGPGPITNVVHEKFGPDPGYELKFTVSLSRAVASGERVVLYEVGRRFGGTELIRTENYSPCAVGATSCRFGPTTPTGKEPVYVAVVTTGITPPDVWGSVAAGSKVGESSYVDAPAWTVSMTRDLNIPTFIRLTATTNYLPVKVGGIAAIYEKDAYEPVRVDKAVNNASSVTIDALPHAYRGKFVAVVKLGVAAPKYYGSIVRSDIVAITAPYVSPPWEVTFDGTTARWNYDIGIPSNPYVHISIYDTTKLGGFSSRIKTCGDGLSCSLSPSQVGAPMVVAVSSASAQQPLPDPTYSVVMQSGDTLVSGDAARELLSDLRESQGGAPSKFESCDKPCSVGQPVNTATGVFWHAFSDVAVPGRGPGLELSRTYSSAGASEAGMFGFGWRSNLETRLVTATDTATGVSTVTVVDGNGARSRFTKNDSGYWAAPRVHAELDTGPGNTFVLTDTRDRTAYTFDAAGALLSVADRNGEVTTLGYVSGRLATVTDAAGRTLSFTWAGARVASVAGPVGRTWTYGYDAAGRLTSAKDPLNRSTSFTYETFTDAVIT